jgi:Nif-specific regulatory protein
MRHRTSDALVPSGPALERSRDPAEKLLVLLRIAEALNSERDLSALLTTIAQEAAGFVDAELASIFLLDASGRELWSRVTLDTDETLRFDAHQGIAGHALESGQIVRVDDAHRDPRFFAGIDAATGHQTRNLLAVPLRNLRGNPIGVFEVLNKRGGTFTDEDVEFAKLLAGQASIALETAQLVGDLRRRQDELQATNAQLTREVEQKFSPHRILGTSAPIREVARLIERIADSSVSVLIQGESGTGKELAAKSVHYLSPRAHRPFVVLNCAALPEALVESELFGIEKGVATGVEARVGKFEAAHEGTLFLDEIGDMSLVSQAKLLRVLQEGVVEHVGGRSSIPVNVRLLAATNKDLLAATKAGTFREDLYYRLNVVQIRMPALRERPDDIPYLARHFLDEYCRERGRPPLKVDASAMACLTAYRWPGNVREFQNEMKRLAVIVPGDRIEASDLLPAIRGGAVASTPPESGRALKTAVEELERRMIRAALDDCGHNRLRSARALGLSRQGLIKKLKRYGMVNQTVAQ